MLAVTQTVKSQIIGRLVNNCLGRIWKGVVMAYLKVLSWYLSGGIEEHHYKLVRIASLQLRFQPRTSKM